MATARNTPDPQENSAAPIPYRELDVLLKFATNDVLLKLMDAGQLDLKKVFTTQESFYELEEEPLITWFFQNDTRQQIETLAHLLKARNIEPSLNVMLAIFRHIKKQIELPTGLMGHVVNLFKDLYKDKTVFKNILQTQTSYGCHIYAYLAEHESSEEFKRLTDEFDLDVNALNKAFDTIQDYSTQRRATTLGRVVEYLLFAHGHKDERHGQRWIYDRCEIIKFLISRDAQLTELPAIFKFRERCARDPKSFICGDTAGSQMKKHIDAARVAIAAIKSGLEQRQALKADAQKPRLSQSSSLFGTQDGLASLLDVSALDKMEEANQLVLEKESASKHGRKRKR